jgi:ketosteroid isomerase-like protein
MNANEVGQKLVALCREGRNMDAIDELYSDDVVSVEAMDPPEGSRESKGIDAIRDKNQEWLENHEVHSASVGGPFPHGDDRFCVHYTFDVTNKPSGQRFDMEEVALYTVSDGKVAREEFFYTM